MRLNLPYSFFIWFWDRKEASKCKLTINEHLFNQKGRKIMYANEILFVDKFLSKLIQMNITQIPFQTARYRDGVYAMKHYFENHIDELGDIYKDVKLLFLNGGQNDFATAIMNSNGHQISLRNPKLETAMLKKDKVWAEKALADPMLDLPDRFMTEITEAFCEAAGIMM